MFEINDFNAIRISLASPTQIEDWSYGEVTEPETINYRTLKPEKDGLFCERIFGPVKNYECYCGKYKKIRYRGVTCERCGVTVEHSKVRRERMGHITLAAPVSHIWFAKGVPSRLALLLDISPRNLERVLYFAQYVVISVNAEACKQRLEGYYTGKKQQILNSLAELEAGEQNGQESAEKLADKKRELDEKIGDLDSGLKVDNSEISKLHLQVLSENEYQQFREKYGDAFEVGMGAEAVLNILRGMNLEDLRQKLVKDIKSSEGQKHKKLSKRLRIIEAFWRSGNKPEWMIFTVLPVLPPELRPIVQLDGGRFATSDLNDLYRRVINRNNRLKKLMELGAPEIIVRNEKRMLQEAVDALIDNGRRGRLPSAASTHKLKSLSDMLRGKQGRFRQNLLGKRVDYSGRSVIVVGPELKLHQCGLPKHMALELFKPFVMRRLIEQGFAHNIKSARRQVERARAEVWDILAEVIKERPVMLNRAPTLHRLSIQAFEPTLIEGSAIQLHPLVCSAFNADFDGDQMAVHVPLSRSAVREAREHMLSVHNMLLPSSGEPVMTPTLDMVLGCYYLTNMRQSDDKPKTYGSPSEAILAYEMYKITGDAVYPALHEEIAVRVKGSLPEDVQESPEGEEITPEAAEIRMAGPDNQIIRTTVGRIIFNNLLPDGLRMHDPYKGFFNFATTKGDLRRLVSECFRWCGREDTVDMLDSIKAIGFEYTTKSGTTIAARDIEVPKIKPKLISKGDEDIAILQNQFNRGLITEEEYEGQAIDVWTKTTNYIEDEIKRSLDRYGGVYMMAFSGAKGNISQIRQMAGIRGLMTDPSGRIIPFPIKASFREGLSVMEYFMSTHGARKGLADTALRTSDAGYLTRRLIDVAQDLIILEEDCGYTGDGLEFSSAVSEKEKSLLPSVEERIKGRLAAKEVVDPNTGEIIVEKNEMIDEEKLRLILQAKVEKVNVRSPLICNSKRGICRCCYGRDLSTTDLVKIGGAVGIISAQSIGEPGTQLTLRTFHTGGVVGTDITTGLPRVEELFEARVPKGKAVLTEIDGTVNMNEAVEDGVLKHREITITHVEAYPVEHEIPAGYTVKLENNAVVKRGDVLAEPGTAVAKSDDNVPLISRVDGICRVEDGKVIITYEEKDERKYEVPITSHVLVRQGDYVRAGDKLVEGVKDPQDILHINGRNDVMRYLIDEVQRVYRSQGVNINDKHIETIVRQMLKRVRVEFSGDTDLLVGDLVDRLDFENINAKMEAEGGDQAVARPVLLGITRASLNTDSWLAAASFQETTRVLAEAAIWGKTDRLHGLKENVIIGKLIPSTITLTQKPARMANSLLDDTPIVYTDTVDNLLESMESSVAVEAPPEETHGEQE
ncbi:MAG: DNA-directed RNA polymerase subunit beta' [Dehalococcoidia bacterium]|nr:DNA-directed RNA polymerase subunit beta' [Dehalococcoidia bacterium]